MTGSILNLTQVTSSSARVSVVDQQGSDQNVSIPMWQAARALPSSQKRERATAFSRLRDFYGFSEYAMHTFSKTANCAWIADHIDAVMAQTLATRAYHAVNRVCLGHANRVRFRSKGRGLDSIEGKRNNTGLRFVLQAPQEGSKGWLVWGKLRIPAIIDWDDPLVKDAPTFPRAMAGCTP